MRDLEERLRGVDRAPVPDQWEAIQGRNPRKTAAQREPRILVIVVALMLSVAAIGGVVVAFRRSPALLTRALPTRTAPGVGPGPTLALPKPGSSLVAIAGTSADDIWAVGETHGKTFRESSLVEHWDGSRWSVVTTPDVGGLSSLVALSRDDAWILGGRAVLHWDGVAWKEVDLPKEGGASYGAISASSSSDVWLAGTRPGPLIGKNTRGLSSVVLHYDGIHWAVTRTPNPGTRDNYLEGIVALSPSDVWAAGYSSDVGKRAPEATSLTMHWDGSAWSVIPSPNPSSSLNVIWGMGSDGASGAWALGHYEAADHHLHAFILRWNGSSWDRMPVVGSSTWSPTVAAGTSPDDVWVVGSEPTSTLAAAHCGRSACTTVVDPRSASDAIAEGVVAITPDDAWIVGTETGPDEHPRTLVEHWDGARWTRVEVPSPGS